MSDTIYPQFRGFRLSFSNLIKANNQPLAASGLNFKHGLEAIKERDSKTLLAALSCPANPF